MFALPLSRRWTVVCVAAVSWLFVAMGSAVAAPALDAPPACTQTGTAAGETITGTPGADVICGLGGNDRLEGGGGSDVLRGGDGADVLLGGDSGDRLEGGAGADRADYQGRTQKVSASIGDGANDGLAGEGDDIRADVEQISGGDAGDVLIGNATYNRLDGRGGDDTLEGRASNDRLIGRAGADTFVGGDGSDLADYTAQTSDVVVSLGGGADDGAGSEGDDVRADVERIHSGSGDDALTGDGDANMLYGGGGHDVLDGAGGPDRLVGGTGPDDLAGGSGEDLADYSLRSASQPVTVTVGAGADDGDGGEGDDVAADVEQVNGGAGPDVLVGDGGANVLAGRGGDDEITGGGGVDEVSGLSGSDTFHVEGDGANVDAVQCGTELDYVFADAADTLSADCENQAPDTDADTHGVGEDDGSATIDVLANDRDPEGRTITVAGVDDTGTTGVVSLTGGVVGYDPAGRFEPLAEGATTTDGFTYTATDGSLTSTDTAVTVTITGVNDAPTATDDTAATDEDTPISAVAPGVLGNDTDVDSGDTKTVSELNATATLTGTSTQGAAVTIDADGSYSYDPGSIFQGLQTGENDTDSFDYTMRDGQGVQRSATVDITITGVSDTPTGLDLDDRSIPENSASGATVGELSTTDADDSSHTYTLDDMSGYPDNAAFAIDGATLKTVANFDYETQAAYDIHVRSTDGGNEWVAVAFTITITDVNEAPTDIGLADTSVVENTTAVDTATTTDPDAGDTHEYAIVGGADRFLFTIDTTSGALAFNTAPNYEAPADADANNRYDVRLRTTDAGGASFDETFGIEVTNVNEAPYALTLDDLSVAENEPAGTKVATASAEDPDNDALTYSMATGAGDDDNATFTFDGADLETAVANLDHENPSDADSDGSYLIRYQVTDGTGTDTAQATIQVDDRDDAPTAVDLDPSSIAENVPAQTEVGTLTSTDQDAGSYAYSLEAGTGDTDNASFAIDGDTVETAAGSSFDFETRTSYSIRVRSVDGAGSHAEQLTITITDVNEAPELSGIESGALAYTENDPAAAITSTLVVSDPDGDGLAAATVQITGNHSSSEDRLSFTDTADIEKTAPFDTATGTLSLRAVGGGTKPLATWETALRDVRYENLSDDPSIGTRTVAFQVDDGGTTANLSNVATRDISVSGANDAPVASDDTFTAGRRAVGNTALVVDDATDGAPDPAGPQKTVTGSILANDADPDSASSALSVTPVTDGPTLDGGTYTLEADGDFTFLPKAGTSCTDHEDGFDYTLSDGTATDTGTVLIDIADCVWYVDGSASAPPAETAGTSVTPFDSLAAVNAADLTADSDTAGDKLFLYPGTYAGGLPLEATEKLLSKRHGLAVDDGDGDGDTQDLVLEAAGTCSARCRRSTAASTSPTATSCRASTSARRARGRRWPAPRSAGPPSTPRPPAGWSTRRAGRSTSSARAARTPSSPSG